MGKLRKEDLIPYTDVSDIVTASTEFNLHNFCNEWSVKNNGTVRVRVNGTPLEPPPAPGLSGESVGMRGNYGEVYNRTTLTVSFDAVAGASVVVVQKIYQF